MQNDVSLAARLRPLAGIRVMVTRPVVADRPHPNPLPAGEGTFAARADSLAERLEELGAAVIVQPAIRISPPLDWRPVDDALARLREFDWLVFSSANGVRALLERWRKVVRMSGHGVPLLGTSSVLATGCARHCFCEAVAHDQRGLTVPPHEKFPRLAAIGPGTADELTCYGLQADLVPEQFRAESLAEALVAAETGTVPVCAQHPQGRSGKRGLSPFPLSGKRFLLARASRGREVLAQRLVAAGARVEQIVVYTSTDVERPDPEIAAMLRAGRIDWISVTSSANARSLARLFGDDLRRAKLASISPITSGVLRELGLEPAAEAAEYTLAGLAAAIAGKS